MMGKGIDAARAAGAGIHADVLDDFKDQLLITLLRRLAVDGRVTVPVAEVDANGSYVVSFNVDPVERAFNFVVERKS
jgi:hypothetical protein